MSGEGLIPGNPYRDADARRVFLDDLPDAGPVCDVLDHPPTETIHDPDVND